MDAATLTGQLLAYVIMFLPPILFMLTQHRTLSAVRKEYRELRPGLVWLQLIPVFNLYWMFVVVTRIADSISKEVVARQDDSILGVPNFDAVDAVSKRPTYKIGMTYCVLFLSLPVLGVLLNFIAGFSGRDMSDFDPVARKISVIVLLLGAISCWIIYWVKLDQNKRKLERIQY